MSEELSLGEKMAQTIKNLLNTTALNLDDQEEADLGICNHARSVLAQFEASKQGVATVGAITDEVMIAVVLEGGNALARLYGQPEKTLEQFRQELVERPQDLEELRVVVRAALEAADKARGLKVVELAGPDLVEQARDSWLADSDSASHINIDDDAAVSHADGGSWVQAWLWLDDGAQADDADGQED